VDSEPESPVELAEVVNSQDHGFEFPDEQPDEPPLEPLPELEIAGQDWSETAGIRLSEADFDASEEDWGDWDDGDEDEESSLVASSLDQGSLAEELSNLDLSLSPDLFESEGVVPPPGDIEEFANLDFSFEPEVSPATEFGEREPIRLEAPGSEPIVGTEAATGVGDWQLEPEAPEVPLPDLTLVEAEPPDGGLGQTPEIIASLSELEFVPDSPVSTDEPVLPEVELAVEPVEVPSGFPDLSFDTSLNLDRLEAGEIGIATPEPDLNFSEASLELEVSEDLRPSFDRPELLDLPEHIAEPEPSVSGVDLGTLAVGGGAAAVFTSFVQGQEEVGVDLPETTAVEPAAERLGNLPEPELPGAQAPLAESFEPSAELESGGVDELVPLLEERLRVDYQRRKIGEVIIRKQIETRVVQVPVRYEKLVIEQISPEQKTLAEVDLSPESSENLEGAAGPATNTLVSGTFKSAKTASAVLEAIARTLGPRCKNVRIEIDLENDKLQKAYQEWLDQCSQL
jgi:hypothetical protein